MPKKYYAVRRGRQTGVFATWAECQAQVKGVSGAEFKSFLTEAEAQTFVKQASSQAIHGSRHNRTAKQACDAKEQVAAIQAKAPADAVFAFTDGACRPNPGHGAAGAIVHWRLGGRVVHNESFSRDLGRRSTNNIAELTGTQLALEAVRTAASDRACSEVFVFTDSRYTVGCLGQDTGYKPKKNLELIATIRALVKTLGKPVHFHWVPGHAGLRENEQVDALVEQVLAAAATPAVAVESSKSRKRKHSSSTTVRDDRE
jgi:ribonuclease HI